METRWESGWDGAHKESCARGLRLCHGCWEPKQCIKFVSKSSAIEPDLLWSPGVRVKIICFLIRLLAVLLKASGSLETVSCHCLWTGKDSFLSGSHFMTLIIPTNREFWKDWKIKRIESWNTETSLFSPSLLFWFSGAKIKGSSVVSADSSSGSPWHLGAGPA